MLTIATVYQAWQMSGTDDQFRKAEELFGQILTQQNKFAISLGTMEGTVDLQDVRVESAKEDIAMLWYGSISPESLEKIVEWYNDHEQFQQDCGEFIEDVSISKGFYGYAGEMADTLRIQYREKGIQAINSKGEINCYAFPIETMTPPPIDCNLLCIEEEIGGEESSE